MNARIQLGVSACLLGEEVRYDGNHKFDSYINADLGRYFELVPVCPEMGAGLGVPRPPIQLVKTSNGIRALGVKDKSLDATDALQAFATREAGRLTGISGYILKKGSPSCGLERVKLYNGEGQTIGQTRGLFAQTFSDAHPLLPMEEEGRLNDAQLRDSFLERVFAYRRWQDLLAEGVSVAALTRFHAAHKLNLLARDPERYAELGKLAASARDNNLADIAEAYIKAFMAALARPVSRGRHVNVLQHLQGYLKDKLDATDKAELTESITAYHRGDVPLSVPFTLLRHHFLRHPHDWVQAQYYLHPEPAELVLRYSR